MKMINRILILGLAVAFWSPVAGCRKPPTTDRPNATNATLSPTNLPSPAPPPQSSPATTSTNLIEVQMAQMEQAFESAPEPTRQRIDAAMEILRSGRKREGIQALKLVDADSDLTPDQAESIRKVIKAAVAHQP